MTLTNSLPHVNAACIDTRRITSSSAMEIYISVTPRPGGSARQQAQEVYAAIADTLNRERAWILTERVYGDRQALDEANRARATNLTLWDNGVRPTQLLVPATSRHRLAGVQIWAARTPTAPQPINYSGVPCGRILNHRSARWVILNAITAANAGDNPQQAQRMFEKAAALLAEAGATFRNVARTWLYLADINAWYGAFNDVRNRFFQEHGLIDAASRRIQLPASTGIGMQPADGVACAMDLIAVLDDSDIHTPDTSEAIELFQIGRDQPSAFSYGSAFARAACAATPAGRTVFVSGTAAIDRAGQSEHPRSIARQIDATLAHARRILTETGASEHNILAATAYCRNESVHHAFKERAANLPWPVTTVPAEVCRPELLFEIELTARR